MDHVKEWHEFYNEFNSAKWLTQYSHWHQFVEGKTIYPHFISLDPSATCELACPWCNSSPVLNGHQYDRHCIDQIADLFKRWGVRATCIGGGGEPCECPEFGYLLDRMNDIGIKIGLVSNGLRFHEHMVSLQKVSWVGVSIDSATAEAYKLVKGGTREQWERLQNNITTFTGTSGHPLIEYKFLLTVDNYREVYQACGLAKRLGFNLIHIRPGTTPTYQHDVTDFAYTPDIYSSVFNQVTRAREDFEHDGFRIMAVTHKHSSGFQTHNNFKRCYAGLVSCTIMSSGQVMWCCNCRYNQKTWLCHIDDIDNEWGSKRHLDMVASIDPQQCPQCTYGPVNEIFEHTIINDTWGRDFM